MIVLKILESPSGLLAIDGQLGPHKDVSRSCEGRTGISWKRMCPCAFKETNRTPPGRNTKTRGIFFLLIKLLFCGPAKGGTKDWLVWKLLENSSADLPAELAGARGEAPSEAGNANFTNWLSVLNKIRTFFRENPDAEF